jgi:hypothetical protein
MRSPQSTRDRVLLACLLLTRSDAERRFETAKSLQASRRQHGKGTYSRQGSQEVL